MRYPSNAVSRHFRISAAALLASTSLCGVANAKSFIDYIQPTPITCSPLTSATWGVPGVLPRDTCNGIESTNGAGVAPTYLYWDGQIIRAKDGVYHMFMSTWADSAGFNPGWTNSESYHATSTSVLGPYMRQGYVWSSGSHHGHNTTAAELLDGTYAVVVSEVVPFTIYKSASLDGPWTACPGGELIQPNGIKTNSTVACNPGGPCNDSHWDSNVSLVARADGRFEIVQRHGFIAIANTLCGPYLMQKPTWTYPQANLPNVDSIYPKRTSIPGVSNPTYGWEEDPHIWYSGGVYHVIYSGSGDRVGWHLYSTDGIHDWKDDGLAYTPLQYKNIFCYDGTSTCTAWYKSERPGVVLEDGHPTHITLAVADVDKDNSIPGGSNHGSKVIVLPFDGVAFDHDYGVDGGGGTAAGGASATGGAGGTTAAGASGIGGTAAGGASATGGAQATGGSTTTAGGTTAAGGSMSASTAGSSTTTSGGATGGVAGGAVTGGSGGSGGAVVTGAGGRVAAGGAAPATGGAAGAAAASDGGCSCGFAGRPARSNALALLGILGLLGFRRSKRRG